MRFNSAMVPYFFQPRMELGLARDQSSIAVLIIQLPAHDVGVLADSASAICSAMPRANAICASEKENCARLPCSSRRPFSSTRKVSGYLVVSQAGGAAVGVPSTTRCGVSRRRDGAVEPAEVVVALAGLHGAPGELANADQVDVAASMRARSGSQCDSGHCSGYQAAPKSTGGTPGYWVACPESGG